MVTSIITEKTQPAGHVVTLVSRYKYTELKTLLEKRRERKALKTVCCGCALLVMCKTCFVLKANIKKNIQTWKKNLKSYIKKIHL